MRRQFIPLVGSIVTPFLLVACAPSSSAPTALAAPTAVASAFGVPIATTAGPSFAACLSASSTPSCFSAATVDRQSIASPASAPAAPLNLVASSSGSAVTLVWSAPTGGDPATQYTIEAGSASGLANLANFSTGNAQTMYQASGVGAGTYFVRVRALNAAGLSGASNEAVLVVMANGPCTAPGAPSGLALTANAGGVVSLMWNAGAGAATSYILEAGSAPGLSNLANSDLGSPAQTFTTTGVASGTYYVRLRAKNACGTSGPSNEIVVSIAAPVPNYAGTWRGVYRITGCTSIDPPGVTPLDLCRAVVTGNLFELVVSQQGPVLTGVYRNISPATTYPCACGGLYGTFNMAGAITPDGGLVLSGSGPLIGTGLSESVTLASIPPSSAGAVGLTGNFSTNTQGAVRATFSAIIVSANRQ